MKSVQAGHPQLDNSSNISTTLSLAVAIGGAMENEAGGIPKFIPDLDTPKEGVQPTTSDLTTDEPYPTISYQEMIANRRRPKDRMAYFADDRYVVDDTAIRNAFDDGDDGD